MKKKSYVDPEMEVVEFEAEDVIADSCSEVNYTCDGENNCPNY